MRDSQVVTVMVFGSQSMPTTGMSHSTMARLWAAVGPPDHSSDCGHESNRTNLYSCVAEAILGWRPAAVTVKCGCCRGGDRAEEADKCSWAVCLTPPRSPVRAQLATISREKPLPSPLVSSLPATSPSVVAARHACSP